MWSSPPRLFRPEGGNKRGGHELLASCTRNGAWLLTIFAVALALRLFYWSGIEAYPKYELIKNRLDDQVVFDLWARSIVAGESFDYSSTGHEFAHWTAARPGVYPQGPLYPFFVATTFRLLGTFPDRVRLLQMFLGALGCVLVYLLARRFLRTTTAGLCGLAASFYGPLLFYESTLLRAGVFNFVAVLGLWLLSVAAESEAQVWRRTAFAVAAGTALALGVLLRANYLLFALPALGWLAWRRNAKGEGRRFAAWGLLGLVLPLLPVVAVNSIRSGAPAFLSSNGPYIFFVGNVHDASGKSAGPSPYYFEVKAAGPPQEISLLREALKDIRQHPRAWLALLGYKTVAFFGPREVPNNLSFEMARETNPRLALAFLRFSTLLPCAACGFVLGLFRVRRYLLLYLFLGAYSASTVAFYVLGRLRQPAVVVLLIFAGLALEMLWDAWYSNRGWRRWLPGAAAVALVASSVALQPSFPRHRSTDYAMAAAAHFSRAEQLERTNQPAAARGHYLRALVLNPAHDRAGVRLERLGILPPPQPTPAVLKQCERARALAPHDPQQARRLLLEAIRRAPQAALPRHYLSNVEFLLGHPRQAMRELEKALELEPDNALFRRNLLALRQQLTL